MKKIVVSLVVSLILIVGSLSLCAQAADQGSHGGTQTTQQDKPMTKEELADAIAHAHSLVTLYAFRYGRNQGSEKEYLSYVYWHNRRQELLKQYQDMK